MLIVPVMMTLMMDGPDLRNPDRRKRSLAGAMT